ncbi:MAG: hypothetical protein GY774_05555 [Planctomycetes bacterium]|nr:hypothetical protein [Planctomycetota bacterium]
MNSEQHLRADARYAPLKVDVKCQSTMSCYCQKQTELIDVQDAPQGFEASLIKKDNVKAEVPTEHQRGRSPPATG